MQCGVLEELSIDAIADVLVRRRALLDMPGEIKLNGSVVSFHSIKQIDRDSR